MARELQDIIRELDASYNPQRQAIQSRLDSLPGQADAEIRGLEGRQTQAFDNILAGARGRGLGFSGIPIQEQAKYTASEFLPAVARVKSSQQESARSLYDALNNVGLEQNRYAQSLRQAELDRDEQSRQFNETIAEQRRQAAAAARSQAGLAGLFGGAQRQATAPQADPLKQRATADVSNLLAKDRNRIVQEYNAIKASAGFGNTYDQLKLQLLESLDPSLRGGGGTNKVSLGKAGNSSVSLGQGGSSSVRLR